MEVDDLLPQALEKIRKTADDAMDTLKQIIYSLVALVILIVIIMPLFAGTVYPQLDSWGEVFDKVDPYVWAAIGLGLTIALSVLGAAWCVNSIFKH